MKYVGAFLLLMFSFTNLFAQSSGVKIHSFHAGEKSQGYLVYLEDGRVVFLRGESLRFLAPLQEAYLMDRTLNMTLDQDHNLLSVESVPENDKTPLEEAIDLAPMSYAPSIVSSTTASNVFYRMRTNYQDDSQCYNRAHIWTYEEYKRTSLLSNKLFLFFTSRYIWAYNFKWWFHVTPMVYVGGSSYAYWRALDRRYTRGPLTIQTWTNIFVYNHATCPVISKWTDYYNHQSAQYCYVLPTSMYYWQPRDMKAFEETGFEKTQFISSEVNYAYWEAF